MAAADNAPATEIEDAPIDAREAELRQQTGSLANGKAAPPAAVVDTSTGDMPTPFHGKQASKKQNNDDLYSGPSFEENIGAADKGKKEPPKYSGGAPKGSKFSKQADKANTDAPDPQGPQMSEEQLYGGATFEENMAAHPAPPAPTPPPQRELTDRLWSLTSGALQQSNQVVKLLAMAGATVPMAIDKVHSVVSGHDITDAQDAWFKNVVQHSIDNDQAFDLGPNADAIDRGLQGVGSTLMFIDQMVASGGRGAALDAAFATTVAQRMGVTAATAALPSVAAAIDRGRQVLQTTNDPAAATASAITAFTMSEAMSALPGGGKGVLQKAGIGAASFGAGGEVQRQAQNAALMGGDKTDAEKRKMSDADLDTENAKSGLHEDFSAESAVTNLVQGTIFGGVHGVIEHISTPRVEEKPSNIMEHAQRIAVDAVRAAGGDELDQAVAATGVNAELGAHHDAAAYEAHMEMRNAKMAMENQVEAEHEAMGKKDQEVNEGFNSLEERRQAARDADFQPALNQVGDQEVARGDTLAVGAEKGAEGAAAPTLGDTLKPEERAAFESLKERRAAEMKEPQTPPVADEDKVMPYVEPKARKLTPEEEEGKPPGVVGKLLPLQQEEAQFSPHPESEPFVSGPPKTLAERREAAQSGARMGNPEDEPLFNDRGEEPPEKPQEPTEPTPPQGPGEKSNVVQLGRPQANQGERAAAQFAKIKEAGNLEARRQLEAAKAGSNVVPIEHGEDIQDRKMTRATNEMAAEQAPKPGTPEFEEAKERLYQSMVARGELPAYSEREHQTAFAKRRAAAEASAQREGRWQRLMSAGKGAHAAIADEMMPGEAQQHMDRLDAAPGDNKEARKALADRALEDQMKPSAFAENNASGESSASLEAQNRVRDEKAAGITRHLVDPDGNTTPLTGVDAVDRKAPPGHVIVQRDGAGNRTILDRGGLSQMHANGLVNRAEARGKFSNGIDRGTLRENVEKIKAMSEEKRDNTMLADFPGGAQAYRLYEAQKMAPKPSENLKRVNDRNSFSLSSDHDAIANVDGEHFGVNKWEDPDAREDNEDENGNPRDYVYAYQHLNDPNAKMIETDTANKEDLFKHMREHLASKTDVPRAADRVGRDQDAPGERRQTGMTSAQATRILQPHVEATGGNRGLQVHDDVSTLPDNLKADMARGNFTSVRGVYDPSNDTVHIIAGSHTSAESLIKTFVHETVAHQGFQHLFGDGPEYFKQMQSIYSGLNSEGKAWVKDYMEQHNLDPRQGNHRALAAEEYAAHLSENLEENPGVLQQVKDFIRAGLRKVGLVREWTDDDLHALLRASKRNLLTEHAVEGGLYKDLSGKFATDEDRTVEQLAHDNPLAQVHKLGKTMEEQANSNKGYVKSRADFLKEAMHWAGDKAAASIDSRLSFIHMRNLPDFMKPGLMPALRGFIRLNDQMTGRRGQMMEKGADKLTEWSKWASKNKEGAKRLGDLMHSSTLAGVDVSKPFEARYEDTSDATKIAHDAMRKDYYDMARREWSKLDDKGKQLYNDVRDHYALQRQEIFNALDARVAASGADNNTKKAIMTQLRQTFESNKVHGPYFPLMRYGDRMGSVHDAAGNVLTFSRFESKSEQMKWMQSMKEAGFKDEQIRLGQKMDDKSMMERIDPDFVKKVTEMAGHVDKHLADEIWQTYLKAMPEMSMRKQLIHRVGRLGYTMDAMRNFANASFHGSHQIARLEYGYKMDKAIDDVKSQADNVMNEHRGTSNAEWAPALAREMQRRYEWLKNPRSSTWASAMTKFGFGWYLGAAPATAFRIFSQNPMLAQPILAKFHGQLGATRELCKASAQWATSKGSLGDTLRGDERRAFDTATNMGVFSSTATQTLASGASDIPVVGKMATAMKAMGYMFNAMEHHNRMTTYLAAYRLGRQQGMSHDTAVEHATDNTWDAHFDYTNANRPRVLQNDYAKVIGLFKQYSWGVTYRLAREARDMINKDLAPEQRQQAMKAVGGLLFRVSMFSGATGLPLSWLAVAAINAAFHDKDRPFDAEAAGHEWLTNHVGHTAASAIMTGPLGAVTGASLSGGASYSDLWYRPPARDENARDTALDAWAQAGGAIPAIGFNAAEGLSMMRDGNLRRGFEHFLPPEIAALAKAERYREEGATNVQGEQIVPREPGTLTTTRNVLDNRDLFLQAIGFTPQKVADQYRQNTALKNISKAIMTRKEAIENAIAMRSSMGDTEGLNEALKEAEAFNSKNPGVAIQARGLATSMKDRLKNQAEAINGVQLPAGLNDLRDIYGGNRGENQ